MSTLSEKAWFDTAGINDMIVMSIILKVKSRGKESNDLVREAMELGTDTRQLDVEKIGDIIDRMYKNAETMWSFDGLMALGVSLYWINNIEMAATVSAMACYRFPPAPLARSLLMTCLDTLHAPESVDEYMSLVRANGIRLPLHYQNVASRFFSVDNFDWCDHYLQRRLAILHSTSSRILDIREARYRTVEAGQESTVEKWKQNLERFTPNDEKNTARLSNLWNKQVNKKQVVNCVTYMVYRLGAHSMIDFGCHAGTVGANIVGNFNAFAVHGQPIRNNAGMDALDNHVRGKYAFSYMGIDHDPIPIREAQANYPNLEFHCGGHEKLLELDRETDLLFISFTCCLLSPEVMDAVAKYALARAKNVILVEDFSNMTGAFPIYRRHYMIHPYARIFDGFDLLYKELLLDPNQAANGIAVFVRKEIQ